jgi:hypothetical protein
VFALISELVEEYGNGKRQRQSYKEGKRKGESFSTSYNM